MHVYYEMLLEIMLLKSVVTTNLKESVFKGGGQFHTSLGKKLRSLKGLTQKLPAPAQYT